MFSLSFLNCLDFCSSFLCPPSFILFSYDLMAFFSFVFALFSYLCVYLLHIFDLWLSWGFDTALSCYLFKYTWLFYVADLLSSNPFQISYICTHHKIIVFSFIVQSLSLAPLFAVPWTAAHWISLLHCFLEFAHIHIHWVNDSIQSSHPLLSPSPTLNFSQHQGLFQWIGSSHKVAKVLESQLQHQSIQ